MKRMNACLRWMAGALALVLHLSAAAEDIDLFLGGRATTSSSAPNVLIILDNTGNWSSPFAAEKQALVDTFNSLTSGGVNVGIMMFTETGGGNSNTDGGYVRAAIRNMDAANKAKYAALVNSFDSINDKSNSGKIGKAMQEAYLYFAGAAPYAGNNKVKADFTGNAITSGNQAYRDANNAIYALPGNALQTKSSTTYLSPVNNSADCTSKNFVIYISNGAAQDSQSDIRDALNALTAVGGDTTTIPITPVGSQENPADEWARFMRNSALGITSYTIDINKVTNGQGPGWTALLKSVANVSGGKYFDVAGNTSDIRGAMDTIFAEIQSVNSVFASVSLPVSVNTQGTYLDQVFIGMFRPDSDSLPMWAGNLKQYKLALVGSDLKLVDAAGTSAINTQTGFITECARSFWTPTTANNDWANKGWPSNTTFCSVDTKASDKPDGNIVEKGAQNYVSRNTTTARVVKTCGTTMGTCAGSSDLKAFNNTNVTQSQLGASSTTERDAIINWVLGQDVNDEDEDGNVTERRRSYHGDVVHSRPVAINYGTDTSPNVVVFYGANDGLLRAINGNQSTALASTTMAAGAEMWAFAPPEFYGKFKRLYANSPRIKVPNDTTTTSSPKDYGMDGPVTAFRGTLSGSTKTFVYAAMRRGGAALYAFDVSDALTNPASPTLKWKIGCAGFRSTDCTSGMSGIGQTWSSAKSFYAQGYSGGNAPLLIFGGGYDTCEDSDPNTCGASGYTSKGAAVYVVDANSGSLVATFPTGQGRGVIADVTLVRDSNNYVTYGYTADLAGNVYRISFGNGAPSSWSMTRIAALGCSTISTCSANRKFMFAPSVVASGSDYAIMIGSGDREKPLTYYSTSTGIQNYFFEFLDKPTTSASTYPGDSDGCGSNIICLSSLYEITTTATPTSAQLATKKGWALRLLSTEQVVTSAITVFGTVTFSTHQPSTATNTCKADLGTTRVYNISYKDASTANGTSSRWERLVGDGLPPSPVAGMVNLSGADGGTSDGTTTTVPFCIGCSKDSALEAKKKAGADNIVRPKNRVYWYIQK